MTTTYKFKNPSYNVGNNLPINFSYKSSSLPFYIIGSIVLIFFCFLIDSIIAKSDQYHSLLSLIPEFIISLVLLGFLYLAAWTSYTMKLRITEDSIRLSKKFFLIGSTNLVESLSNYLGIEQRMYHDSDSQYSSYSINLTHKSDKKLDIELFESETSITFNQETEKFARILNLPIISRSGDNEIILRSPDQLDMTFAEVVEQATLIDNFNILDNPYPEKISLDLQDKNLVINIKLHWNCGYIYAFAMLMIAFTLIYAALNDFSDLSVMITGLQFPIFLLGFVVLMYFGREKITLTPDRFANQIYWRNFLIYSNQVQWVQVEDINYSLGSMRFLKLSGDQLNYSFGWSLNANEQKWFRNLIIHYLVGKSDKLFKNTMLNPNS